MSLIKSNCLLLLVLVALAIIQENPASSDDSSQGNNRLTLARCNYTEVGLRSCASCHDVMLCTPLDVGILLRCGDDQSHCNKGACSVTPSPNCNNTSSQRRRPTFGFTIRF